MVQDRTRIHHPRPEAVPPARADGASHTAIDLHAAEALAAAMTGWDDDEVECYREAVAAEVARLGAAAPDGFLAAEVLALAWIDAATEALPA